MKLLSYVIPTALGLMSAMLCLCASVQAAEPASHTFYPGDVIRGSQSAVYYYGSDGKRYVFPNEKTYFTWYQDFSRIKIVPDAQLTSLPLGRTNVTYRPGRKMIKVPTDPRVYVIDRGGIIRHVLSEELAQTLYGISWKSLIEDVPDEVFANYTEGPPIAQANQYVPSDVMTLTTTIDHEKQLPENQVTINIGEPGVGFTPPTFSIRRGMNVRWVNTDIRQHQLVGGDGWTSDILDPGDTFEHVFVLPGSYTYSDLISRSMEGNINVLE